MVEPDRQKAVIALPLAPSLLDQLAEYDLTVLPAGDPTMRSSRPP